MKKSFSLAKTVFAVSAALCGFAYAESPRSVATGGLFTSESDDIQSVTDFSSVEFEKFFASSNFHSDYLDIGGAFKVGSVFVSPWYTGYFGSESSTSTKTNSKTNVFNNYDLSGFSTTNTEKVDSTKTLNNEFDVLLGFKNIGVKIGFIDKSVRNKGTLISQISSTSSTENNTYDEKGNLVSSTGTSYDSDGYSIKKDYKPSLEVGTSLEVSGFSLKPYAGFAINITETEYDYSNKNIVYPTENETITKTSSIADYTDKDIIPSFGISADLPKSNDSKFLQTVSLDWTGNFYSMGDRNVKTVTVKNASYDTATGAYAVGDSFYSKSESGDIYDDNSKNQNEFNLGYKMQYDYDENLALSWKANLGFSISNEAYKYRAVTESFEKTTNLSGQVKTVETTKKGASTDYESSSFKLAPSLALGMKYSIVPEKLDFNLGGAVNLPILTTTSKSTSHPDVAESYTKTTDYDGTVTEEKTATANASRTNSEEETATWSKVSGSASFGLTWYLSKNVYLDSNLLLGIDNSTGFGSSVFSSSWYIGATLKY